MTAARLTAVRGLLAVVTVIAAPALAPGRAGAVSCHGGGVEVDLAGSGDVAVVSGHSAATCQVPPRQPPGAPASEPYATDEILCWPDQTGTTGGRCGATPCQGAGLSFAVRTLHDPGGRERVAGFACMQIRRARVGPAITAAQVLDAVRKVKLPGGTIRATPSGRGLANLPTRLRLGGVASRTVDLPLGGSIIHAEFQVVEYRWTFGDGSVRTRAATGSPDAREAAHAFSDRGRFEIRVEIAWSAEAFLDGHRVGRVDDLVSGALISYPVAEVHTALSG